MSQEITEQDRDIITTDHIQAIAEGSRSVDFIPLLTIVKYRKKFCDCGCGSNEIAVVINDNVDVHSQIKLLMLTISKLQTLL